MSFSSPLGTTPAWLSFSFFPKVPPAPPSPNGDSQEGAFKGDSQEGVSHRFSESFYIVDEESPVGSSAAAHEYPSYPPPPSSSLYPSLTQENLPSQPLNSLQLAIPVQFNGFPEPHILSRQLLADINQLKFDVYDPSTFSSEADAPINVIVERLVDETSQKFPEDNSDASFLHCLDLSVSAILDIRQFTSLNAVNQETLEKAFRKAMVHHLTAISSRTLVGLVEIADQHPGLDIQAITQQRVDALNTFEGQLTPHSSSDSFFDQHNQILNSLKEELQKQARAQILNLPLDQQSEKASAVIDETMQHIAQVNPLVAVYFGSCIRQTLADFLLEEYAHSCKTSFEQGTLTIGDLETSLNIVMEFTTPLHYSLSKQRFIEKTFGTTDIAELRKRIEIQEKEKIAELLSPRNLFKRFSLKSLTGKSLVEKQKKITEEQGKLINDLEILLAPVQAPSSVDTLPIPQTTPEHKPLVDRPIDQLEIDQPIVDQQAEPLEKGQSLEVNALPPESTPENWSLDQELQSFEVLLSDQKPQQPMIHSENPLPADQPPQPVVEKIPSIFLAPLPKKPIASYVHIAFQSLLDSASDQDLYNRFSAPVQKDLMRHLYYLGLKGPAEERVEAVFEKKVKTLYQPHTNFFYIEELKRLDKDLVSQDTSSQAAIGEKILEIYYRGEQFSSEFIENLEQFDPQVKFLQYVRDQAQEANILLPRKEIEWARNNFKNPHFVHLTMQALERYLHTAKQ